MMRSRVIIALGLALLAALAGGAAWWSRGGAAPAIPRTAPVALVVPPAPSPDAAPTSAPGEVVVTEVRGRVERLHGKVWRAVAVGEVLDADDQLRTGEGEVTLAIATVGTVVLAPGSDFEVGRRTQELAGLQLGRGRLSADVTVGGGTPLRIAIRDTDVIAESIDGNFSVLSGGAGAVAVAVERGAVDLTASARTVTVRDGELSVVDPGAAPSSPRAIPPSLILKLARLPTTVTTREVILRGRTTPGARVTISSATEVTVSADASGGFTAQVQLVEGNNRVSVAAWDPLGQSVRRQVPVIVDTQPPDVEAEVRWGAP